MTDGNESRLDIWAVPGIRHALIVGILGVVITGALFGWLWTRAERDATAQLETQLESVLESGTDALGQVAESLISLGSLFRSSVLVTPEEFRTFTSDIGLAPGMSGVVYVALTDQEDLEQLEALLEARHGRSVEGFELDADGEVRPLEPRPEYFLIQYATLDSAWGSLVGYDVASDERVADTVKSALEVAEPVVTPFFSLPSASDRDLAAMVMAVPPRDGGDIDALVGAIVDFDDLVSTSVPAGVVPHISLDYFEGAGASDSGVSDVLEYGGRAWTLSIDTAPGSPFVPDRGAAFVVLVIGLVASTLGAVLVILAHQRIEASTALAAAEQATESKKRFIAAVSHELRTPLTTVLGFAEILKTSETFTTEERLAMMKAITEESTDLAHLIDDLLVAARGEIGQLAIANAPVVLRDEIGGVAAASGVGSRLRIVPPVAGNETVLADPMRVRQIVRNLIENARRYGGDVIEMELIPGDTQVRLEVRDNGGGLPDDVGQRAFAPYEHFAQTVGLTESLGLGLTVSAQLAILMDGRVSYERRGDWTVFSLTLPAVTVDHQQLEEQIYSTH